MAIETKGAVYSPPRRKVLVSNAMFLTLMMPTHQIMNWRHPPQLLVGNNGELVCFCFACLACLVSAVHPQCS
jgi:hypothetical protein